MDIYDYQELTLEDFPGHLSAICFIHGCQLRCPYCHNPNLVLGGGLVKRNFSDFINYLKLRKNMLDGVVFTGGEPLIHDRIIDFISEVKGMGFKVKLDTNGGFPKKLDKLLEKGLLDYVALDYKGDIEIIKQVTGLNHSASYEKNWTETLSLLDQSQVDFEIRTTLIKGIHVEENLITMSNTLKENLKNSHPSWFLQSFYDSGHLLKDDLSIDIKLESYTKNEINELAGIKNLYPAKIR